MINSTTNRVIKWNPKFDRVENDRIFFHETTGGDDLANLRQLCAVESAARENPDRSVQIYLQSDYLDNSSSLYSLMKEYSNVIVILINSTQYFENTVSCYKCIKIYFIWFLFDNHIRIHCYSLWKDGTKKENGERVLSQRSISPITSAF